VVIGNPPYVQLQSMGETSTEIEKMNFKSFEKTGDLYCLFYELGNNILKDKGLLGYITSNKWLRANYGKSLRNYLLENTQPLELIDLGSGIFDSATVDSNILIFKNTFDNGKEFSGLDISKEKAFVDFSNFEYKRVKIFMTIDKVWSITSKIEQNLKAKIDKRGISLKDWNIEVKYGIKTGLNEAFIINKIKRDELISEDPKCKEIIVPVLRGRDVNKYQIDYQDLYLINTHNGFKNQQKNRSK
jgi:type I restriction-modification system DNA methylase subunit